MHGDIKPSNVLVVRRGEAESDWPFRLADIDSSALLDGDGYRGAVAHGGTPAYAAPEALRGDARPVVPGDGLLIPRAGRRRVSRCGGARGHSRLRGARGAQRRCAAGPGDGLLVLRHGAAPDPHGRAPVSRPDPPADPGHARLRRMAAQRGLPCTDPGRGPPGTGRRPAAQGTGGAMGGGPGSALARGRRSGNRRERIASPRRERSRCSVPHRGRERLQRRQPRRHPAPSWNTAALRSDALHEWLGSFSPNAAAQIKNARQMDPDAGLLKFCALYYPGGRMPPVWRGESISAPNLAGLAARAISVEGSARSWLLDFLQQESYEFFVYLPRCEEVTALVDSIRRTRREHHEAWSDIANAGGPNEAPDDDESWVQAVLIACSPIDAAERAAALSELFDPLLIMRRAEWFFVFGTDPDRISPSQLFVLRSLRRSSLYDATNIDYLDDLRGVDTDALRAGLVLPATQRRLSDGLSVRPGAHVVNLASGDTYAPERTRRGDRRPPSTGDDTSNPAQARRADEGPRLRMRVVRLAIRLPHPAAALTDPAAAEDEVYLAMVSRSGAGPNARPVLADPGPLPFSARLSVPVPAEGHLQLVLAKSTRVHLTGRRIGRPERRRRSIQVLTGRRHPTPIRPLVAGLLPLRSALRSLRDKVRSARPARRLRARPRQRSRPTGRLIASVRSRSIRLVGMRPLRLARAILRATARVHQVRVRKVDGERARRYTPGVEGRTRS